MKAFSFVFRFTKGLKTRYAIAIFCIVLAASFSFLNPLVIRFVIDSVLGGKAVSSPIAMLNFSATLAFYLRSNLWLAGLAILAIGVIGHGFTYLRSRISAQVAEEFARRLREALYDHIQRLPYAWHSKVQTGDIIQRCTSDVDTIRRFISLQFIQLGRGIFMVALILPIMLSMNPRLTLYSTIVIPFVFTYALVFFRQVRNRFKAQDEAEGFMTTTLEESISGIRVVKAFAREDYENERFGKAATDYRDKCRKLITVMAWYWASSDALCMLQIALVLIFGIGMVIRGQLTLGTMLAFSSYIGMLIWPIREMGRILTDMGRTQVSISRLREVLETPLEEMSGLVPENHLRLKGALEFKQLSFAYTDGSPILTDINLKIAPGETIVILGATGAGKSTLTNLIPRLFDYSQGQILVDGIELNLYNRQYIRSQIGIVLQEPFLYARSLADNIGIAAPDHNRETVIHAAKEAALDSTISEFEHSYDTVIGERGVTLSGGQRQRCAIARALILDAPILILDDALSAVDTETEEIIQRNLLQRKGRSTTIIITHRLSSVALADRIVVLEHGRIAQIGTHNQLIGVEGVYARIWNIQHLLEQEVS
ncbi:MAG: ABC transporter ATP-binding protein [Candidatus Cloacimonas sp.]|jgi:ATP-binding cassette subfamily B protein|nr:ABC transporter ATP-binding protein [Candidatus Cloacimonas sp.]